MALSTLVVRDGNNAAQNIPAMADLAGNLVAMSSLDSSRQTYRASAARAATITTTAKTILTVTGSATKTVRIQKIGMYVTAGTAAEFVLQLQRVSAIGTGGTVVSPTVAKLDTGTATATAVVSHYTTGAQSQGTAVGGPITSIGFNQAVTTSAPTFLGQSPFIWLFPECGVLSGQALVLRGVADILEVQNVGAMGTTPATSYFVEWVEDAS